ncbi:unnamed protein product [Ilex paraguariensis]|uniref:Uncharacterized protein n=1 Tax=Ilex paraguariensis TaxID=185542 RepID=A0ABC8TTK0_9AQUA
MTWLIGEASDLTSGVLYISCFHLPAYHLVSRSSPSLDLGFLNLSLSIEYPLLRLAMLESVKAIVYSFDLTAATDRGPYQLISLLVETWFGQGITITVIDTCLWKLAQSDGNARGLKCALPLQRNGHIIDVEAIRNEKNEGALAPVEVFDGEEWKLQSPSPVPIAFL